MRRTIMTVNELASIIAKAEGKKHQASIGDIREILKILRKILKGGAPSHRFCGVDALRALLK
jgi:hypothetical protein